MSTKTKTKGYKVTDKNMQCRGFQFEIKKPFATTGTIKLCENGFHFCEELVNCFKYHDFDPENRVFEVEASGSIEKGDDKSCCSTIILKKEISWHEVLSMVNTGKGNTGHSNAGNYNAGNRNAGYDNAGNYNAGNYNAGNYNAGNYNAGYANAGNYNAGNYNAGNYNAGNYNAGNRNAGNRNAGYANAGNYNAGNYNAGNYNAGNYNAGNYNAGYANAGNYNCGAFCAATPKYMLFDKPSSWTFEDWKSSEAFDLLNSISTTQWIPSCAMSDEEKKSYPYHVTTEGYTKQIPFQEAFQNSWHNWSEKSRKAFMSLPNFDKEVFKVITGVDVEYTKGD